MKGFLHDRFIPVATILAVIIALWYGLAVVLNGILNLAQALDQRRSGYVKWIASLAMAILTIAAGAFIFFHAFGLMKAAVMVIGVIIIYNGASNLWIESRYKKI